jgi:hypothetical protein
MIVQFRHKGLERLFNSGDISGINVQQARRLRQILLALNNVEPGRDRPAGLAAPSVERPAPRTMGGFSVGQLAGCFRIRWIGRYQR